MTSAEIQTKSIRWIVAAAAAAAVFTLDLMTTLGYAVPMLYGIPLLLTWFGVGVRSTFLMTGVTILLTWGGAALSPGEVSADVIANRTMASGLLLVIGWLVINRKRLAEQRDADQASLRESEERYALVVAGAEAAIWDWNVPEKRVFFSPRWKALRGLAEDEVSDHETEWSSRIHPDDRERVMAAVRAHFEGRTAVFSEEYRIRHVDGRWIWILDHGVAKRDRAGKVVRMAGSESDITERKRMEGVLRDSEERFRTMAQAVPSFLFETDAAGWNVWTSEGWCRFTGQTPEQVAGHGWAEALHPDDRAANIDRWMQCMQVAVPFEAQQRLRRSDGTYVWVIARALPVRDSYGKLTRWVGSVTNVDDIMCVQEALRESEERFAKAFRTSPNPIGITEVATGRCIDVNEACLQLFGFRREEVIGNTTLMLGIWPNQLDRARLVERLKAGEPVRNLEASFKTRSGELRHILVSSDLAELSGTLCLITVGNDITERKQAEDTIRRTAADLAEAQRVAKLGSWRFDVATDRITLSDQMCTMFEVEPSPLGETYEAFLALVHPDDRPGVVQANVEARLRGTSFDVEFRIMTRDGSVKTMRELGYASRDAGDQVVGLFGTVQDITERKRVETALRESEDRLVLALESANMGTWEWDAETDVLQWNHWQFTLFGVRPGSSPWTGSEALSTIHADDRAGVAAAVRSVMEEGVTVGGEFRVVHADGSVRWLFGSGRPVQDERGRVRHVVGVCLDITERRLAQEEIQSLNESLEVRVRERTTALVEANERWDWVVRATNDGVWDWDLLHDTLYHSPRWREMHGFSGSDRTESTKEWLARIHPEDRDRVHDAFDRCRTDQGAQLYQEYRIRRKDGTYFCVLDRGITIFDNEGCAIRMVGAETDITALKSSEALLREREAQLHDLGVRLLRAQEEERRRISRDLHDDVMQRMGALALELYGLASSMSSQDMGVSSQLKTFGAAAEQLTTDLQQMAHQLHPSVLEFGGLEMAMREHVNEFAVRTGLPVELMTRDIPKEIPLDQATCLYRVLQEALQNVQKHAEATAVLVRLLRTDRGLGLCIHDDGRGIENFDGSARRKGLGLTSMMERVGMLGGTFRLRTKPNDGTEIHAWLPLEDTKGEA